VPGFKKRETLLAIIAIAFVLWYPFATVVFLGFYFGRYLDDFRALDHKQHLKTWIILLLGSSAVLVAIVSSPNLGQSWSYSPVSAFVVSYRTNEVNHIASLVALALAFAALFSTGATGRSRLISTAVISVLGVCFFVVKIPLLLLWVLVVVGKLLYRRSWGLLVPFVVAILLPYG